MISVAFLVVLFSVQRYATSKVGIVIGPALLIWFFLLGTIGVYNLIKYDSSVLKAFNPVHIYYFFVRNSTKAWYSLGGCLLCATGIPLNFITINFNLPLFINVECFLRAPGKSSISYLQN